MTRADIVAALAVLLGAGGVPSAQALPACTSASLCDCRCGVVSCEGGTFDCGACPLGLGLSTNPHYLQDLDSGQPRLLAGYGSIVPTDRRTTARYLRDIDALAAHGVDYARVWHWLPWLRLRSDAIWPWGRDGNGKFDVDGVPDSDGPSWNPDYWNRLTRALQRATDKSTPIVSEVLLFEGQGLDGQLHPDFWQAHPWHPNNNNNALGLNPVTGVPSFYGIASDPVRNAQNAYLDHMIQRTVGCNVVYEVENEHRPPLDPTWVTDRAALVKQYVQAYGPPRLVSYSTRGDAILSRLDLPRELQESDFGADFLAAGRGPDVDVLNVHLSSDAASDATLHKLHANIRWLWQQFAKPINVDEFANCHRTDAKDCVTAPSGSLPTAGTLRKMAWMIVASGGNLHIEDAPLSARPYEVSENIRQFVRRSKWQFEHAAPVGPPLWDGGYCMVKPGAEWVCYYLHGGDKHLSLPAGNYTLRWWDPRADTRAGQSGFRRNRSFCNPAGGKVTTTPPPATDPGNDDWILHIRRNAPPSC